MMRVVPLDDVADAAVFGGKARALGVARRAGLPVPDGRALAVDVVEAIAGGAHHDPLAELFAELGCSALAVRSSAVGEDGLATSFAGQHVTKLNVTSAAALVEAVRAVWESGRSAGALAYRARLGIAIAPRVAVIVQRLVRADIAGVLFTRDPLSGADERVIEAAWGLGDAVVAGRVVPDRYRIDRAGRILARTAGAKDVLIAPRAGGGVEELAVDPVRTHSLALHDTQLAALHELACRCEHVFGRRAHDIEWALDGDNLHLLQCRPITR